MSYSLKVYLLAQGELERRIGSKDKELSRSLISQSKEAVESNTSIFGDEIKRGAPTLDQAIDQLIMGEASNREFGFQYGYALEVICERYGRCLVSDLFQEYRSPWMQEVEVIDECFYKLELPVHLPRPGDFPYIGYASADHAGKMLAKMKEVDLTMVGCFKPVKKTGMFAAIFGKGRSPAMVDDEVFQGRQEVLKWLNQAVETHEEIVTFEY